MSRTPAARILVVLHWMLIAPLSAAAQQSTPLDQTEQEAIRALILQTIRENPEVLVETLLYFQEEAQAEAEAERRKAEANLRHWVAEESISLAEKEMKQEMNQNQQNKLVNKYMDELSRTEGAS